jgi:Methyltransferase domain
VIRLRPCNSAEQAFRPPRWQRQTFSTNLSIDLDLQAQADQARDQNTKAIHLSTVIPKLFGIYRAAGHEPVTGHSPFHFFNWRDAPFTRFLKGKEIHGTFGIALQEVMFIERFREFISPRRILIIGNAHGWSTIALALIFPDAKIVAIDPDPIGVEFTNRLIAANGLPATAVVASSPADVTRVVNQHLDGPVDFSLIDAIHENEAVKADFDAVKRRGNG